MRNCAAVQKIISDLRAFVFVFLPSRGFLLLDAMKHDGRQYEQLPGGRVDILDFWTLQARDPQFTRVALQQSAKASTQLRCELCRVAAAREVHEETGLDIALERFTHLPQLSQKKREYFELILDPKDSRPPGLHMWKQLSDDFAIVLSKEHISARFEPSCIAAAESVQLHSGGKCSMALLAYARELPPRNFQPVNRN